MGKLEKTSIIKGSVLYSLGKNNYLDKPKNCFTKGMYYDAEQNITYIKLRRDTWFTEIFCVLLACFCIVFTSLYCRPIMEFHYNDVVIYNDELLFLNIWNDYNSAYKVTCSLYVDSALYETKVLNAGEWWISIPLDNCPADCYLKIMYDTPILRSSKTLRLSVVDRSKK